MNKFSNILLFLLWALIGAAIAAGIRFIPAMKNSPASAVKKLQNKHLLPATGQVSGKRKVSNNRPSKTAVLKQSESLNPQLQPQPSPAIAPHRRAVPVKAEPKTASRRTDEQEIFRRQIDIVNALL
jgi:hypothetical protein